MRGGPGLGTIQPSQADYFQAVKGGGHGDYHLIALAPASVQEMADFVALGFDLAFKYRNPAIILADGKSGTSAFPQTPYRRRNKGTKSVGDIRKNQKSEEKCHHLSRTRSGNYGAE